MNGRFPHPKRYWIYMGIILVCAILLFLNIFRVDARIGEKAFWEFAKQDWQLFIAFLIEELIIAGIIFLFSVMAGRISIKRNKDIVAQREKVKFLGIEPSEYDYIWFDFSYTERALILKQEGKFKLCVDEYCDGSENWKCVSEACIYDDLSTLKKALFYEFDFFCEENAELDKHGDEIYREFAVGE